MKTSTRRPLMALALVALAEPRATGDAPEDHRENRRVEITYAG